MKYEVMKKELFSYTNETPEDIEFTVPEGVETVNLNVFRNCKYLKRLIIGKDVRTINLGSRNLNALNYEELNSSIEEILVDDANTRFYSINGILFGRNINYREYLIKVPPKYRADTIAVNYDMRWIEPCAFAYCSEVKIIVFQREYEANRLSFEGCTQLSQIDGLSNLKLNRDYMPFNFSFCQSLPSVTIAAGHLQKPEYFCNNYKTMFAESGLKEIIVVGFEKKLTYATEILNDMREHNISLIVKGENGESRVEGSTLPEGFLKLKEYHIPGYDKAVDPKIIRAIKKGLKLKDSSGKSTAEQIQMIINEYSDIYYSAAGVIHGYTGNIDILEKAEGLRRSQLADELADEIDHDELMALLSKYAYGQTYRSFLLAYIRYADQSETEQIISDIKKKKRGQKKDKYWAQNAEYALYLNDCPATAQYFKEIGEMEPYALFNGIDLQGLKDEAFFVTIESDDKKAIKKAVKEQVDTLCKLHVVGDIVSLNAIKKADADLNIRPVIRSIVWMDDAGTCFMVADGGYVNENGEVVSPSELVKPVYVTDLSDAEIRGWRDYLVTNNIRQPFDQIWEPIVKYVKKYLPERYENLTISKSERNELKKRLKTRGIDMKSDEMEREYNPYSGQYEFSNENDFIIGSSIRIHYTINLDDTITMGRLKTSGKNVHEINSVLYELDRLNMVNAIKRDDVDAVGEHLGDGFTAAQIFDFVKIASKNNAPMCSAALIEYRNNNYSEIDIDQEFTLDF